MHLRFALLTLNIILLFSFSAWSGPVTIVPTCGDEFQTSPHGLEWLALHFNLKIEYLKNDIFARSETEVLPADYVSNMIDVMMTFDSWLQQPKSTFLSDAPSAFLSRAWNSFSDGKKLLSTLHYQATLGKSGARMYWPGYRETFQTLTFVAGVYRNLNQSMPFKQRLRHQHEMTNAEVNIAAQTGCRPADRKRENVRGADDL